MVIEILTTMLAIFLLVILGMLSQTLILHLHFRHEQFKESRKATAAFMSVYFILMVAVFLACLAISFIS